MDEQQRRWRLLARAGVVVAGVVTVSLFGWFVHYMVSTKTTKPQRQIQTVTLIRPPPPPVDQPPPPPPPDRPKEEIAQNEPEPTPSEDAAPATQLGLDTEGTAGGDSFGLAAHKGGHDLIGTGGAVFGWYTARLKDRVSERLSADARLRAKKFNVSLRVYIEGDGRIRDVRVVSTTGNGELDAAIEAAVAAIGKLNEAPPLEMPEPITIRIISRAG